MREAAGRANEQEPLQLKLDEKQELGSLPPPESEGSPRGVGFTFWFLGGREVPVWIEHVRIRVHGLVVKDSAEVEPVSTPPTTRRLTS